MSAPARLTTPVTDTLDIAHPVLLAPMAAISGGALAAAVSEAGGLGLIGGGYAADPGWVDAAFEAAGGARVGVGFITWALDANPAALDRALAHAPAAVMLSFGDPAPHAPRIRESGAKLICQVQTLAEARHAAACGADVVVAHGQEGGGHGRIGRGTLGLVAAAVEAVAPVPVAAAGGIADGRGLAAALALGAGGVLMGTRFHATPEAVGAPAVKRALCAGAGDDTVFTGVFDRVRGPDWPAPYTGHALANDLSARWRGREHELDETARAAEAEAYRAADAADDLAMKVVWAGEAVDLIDALEPAGDIVRRTVAEAADALRAAAGRVAA